MVGLMSVCKLIFLILWSFGFLIFTSCVKAPAYEFDLHLYQVDESLLECPSGWHKFRNNCYFIVKEETTFQEADILCKRYGGYLVKIDGYNTNKGLGQLITNHNLSHVWIGLQRKQSGEFWWSNGQLAEVEDGFWANQSPILPSEYDLCTVMNLSTSNYGDNRWTLDHCDIRFSSICQTSACVAGQFRCSDGNGCISNSWICDGVYQCSDRSDEQLCSGSCGGHLQGILQTFHSPYYPQTYPKYSSCVWRLETPVGTRVKLKFESFMVEELYDKVIIYDGSSENDPLVGTYSGNTIPNVPYSSSNFILVIFQSDQDNQMSGFNATFLAVPKDECGSVLNASDLTQWLTSPNFPNSYPNNVICDWVIRSKNTEDLISFQFISLSLDTSDFVEIRQGESVDSPLYGRYTGEHIPPVFVATSHSLFVRLYTDNTKAAIGFNATFSIGCKNTIRNGYARIMSPGYGITKYPNSINCNWTIIDPEKRQLTLVFDQFDTEKDYDNVTVYLDNQTDYRHSGPVTPLPIRIDSDIFFITFNPDSQVNRKGWSLTVSYDCPSLNLTDHLKINSSTTTFGTYVLFSCDKGYQLSGTSVLICDIGGRWSASSPPTCKVINCGSPALPDNMALVSLDTTRYLGNAVYRCNPGFVMTTGKVSICQSNGKWSLPYCTELNCPKLATSERLTFSSNTESHYVYGDIVTYNCDSNYRLIGASMTYCTANGTWSKSTPMCKAPMCPQIYILNGYTNTTEDISGGDYVFVTCNHGYTLIGSPVVHCGLNGMYTSLPSCQEVNECETGVCGEHTCQNLPGSYRCVCNHGYQNHPDNQTICTDVDECAQMRCNDICKNYDGGFQCKCVPGLHLYTEDTRVVKQKILWPNKTCIAKCPSFTVSNGGIIISDTYPLSTGEYIAPTTVSIHCPHGTIPDGSETVECHMGGAWNDTVTTCFNQPCQQLSAPSNGHVTYSNISRVYNSVATYSCDQGYELHGVKYRYCQSVNGSSQFEWTGIAPLCKEKMCPTLPDPTNGKAVYASTAIGSTMKYNCNCGYHLIGSQSRICQPEGLWDGRNAICAPSSVCQSPVTYSSIKLSKVLPFYAVGSEINYQCGKPGYEISETTALKCVIERPTRRPTFDLLFEMKFLTLASFNQSCVNVYVKEIVELFKLLVQNNCTRPRPSEKIIADVKNGNVLQVDLTIQLSKPEGGSISSVCQCRSKLLMIVNTGEIQKNLNNHTLNGSGDETCPVVRLKTVDNISITSNWTCGKGYEFVYSKDTCTTDLEPVCVKSTDCPDIYVSPTTISPLTTDPNVPISPINETTDDQTETTTLAIVSTKDHASMTTVSNETLATSDTITKDAIDDEETSYRRSTYEYISSSSEFSTDIKQKPSPTTVDVVNDTEVSVSENQIMTTEFTSAIMATSQKSTPVSVVMETTSVNQMIFNDTVSSTVIVQTTPKSITSHVTSEQQTFSPDVDSDTTIKSTTKILVTEEGTSQITAQKNISDGSVMDTTAETMETGQTTQTAVEFTTENLMTVNATDLTIDHSDDTTESKNEDTTDLNITHTGRSTTSWENFTASNPEESTPKVTTVSKMSKVTTINSNTNTQPTPTIPDFFTVGDTSTTGSTKLTTHSINKTINVEATTQTVFSQSGFLTTNISTVSTQRGDQPEETSVSIQTDSQTEITSVPIQTDSQTEGTYVSTQTGSQTGRTSVSTQTDSQAGRTSVPTQTDSQTGRTSVPTQTDSQTGRTYVSTQTDSQTGRTSVSTYTEDQPQTITTPQLTQTVNASQPTQVTSTSGSEVTSVSVSEVTSASVSGVTSTSFSEVTSTSVSEVSNTSVSEGSSASVSEVSSASVSESEVSSIMTHSVTSPPKTSTSKETEITLPTSVLPKYVIQIYSVLKPTELTEQCKTEINLYISSILNSTAGVSGTLQSSKLCSKYIIRVTIETTIKMKATSIEVTKTYGLSGQIQSILTPCGESIAEKLFSELKDSLTDLPSKTTCLQSLESSNIAINQWKCIDGYILDSSGEICNIVEQTTVLPVDVTTVSPHVTTISEHSRTTVTKNVTMVTTNPDTTSVTTTTAIVTEAPTSHTTQTTTKPLSTTPTTTEPSSTTPTSTTTAMTTPGSTLPPTSLPFYLIQVEAVYTGTNLTWDGCINGMRSQIEEKVKAVSESIIFGLKSWKRCSKQKDLVLLTKTGKISVVPDKLELTAPFAIQSSSGQVDTVTDCAINSVQNHVNNKFSGLLSEVDPGVCYVTYAQFNITFTDWSCNDHYKYNGTSHICHLIQTTTTSLNGLEASDIKYFFPHGRLLLSVESFANVSMTDEAFCLSEYRNILASLLISQTVMINAGNLFDTNCPDIFISLYGIDVHPDDLNISVSKLIMTGDIAVKLFSTSASVTKDGLIVCLGYLASVFMTVNNHILIGQSTIPSSNHSHCSNVALSTVNLSNYFSDCTSGYVRASPGDVYYLCLRDNRTKYIVSLKMSYTWLPPTNKMCIDRLMSELSTSSLYYVGQYAANPEQPCTSDIVLQYTNVTASLLSTYTTGNITMIYELSSITETAAPLSGCSGVIIRNAETYFDEKLSGVFSSIAETCGSTPPQVVMSDVSGSYVCPDGKVWNQVTYQCLIPDGRKKRKKRSAELVRRKRSNTVDTTAYWNSSFPTCIDIEPPVFHNCPSEDLTIYKEAWGPVFINISLPTAVDNSGISPRVTVIPADFRQPYLFRENTDVIFTAEDDTGNSAQCSIQVNLIDVYPLTITCPSEVVYIPYATINYTVFIRYNNTGVTTSSSTTHIQYHPPAGSLISINDHVNVMATAYDTTGNSTSCNFTYEATRDDQLPEYSIKVSYLPPNVNVVVNLTCSMKYGSELIWIFSNISVPQCDDYFMLVPDLLQKHGEQYLVMNVALGFKKMIVLDLDKMENCGNLSAQKMTELGNITLAPSGCNEITLLAVQEETTQEFLCPSNFTVLNKTSKFCTYCRKGTFSNMTSGACEICPITQETIPTECTVCSGRSSHCLDTCKPGEYSPTGLQPCTKCAVGTYTEISNATICRSCPSGKSTINTGTSSLTQCLAGCPIGQYSETGLVPCKPCPQMFYTDTTRSQFCTECSPGLVTTSTGSSSASQCIDPNVCDSDKVCLNGGSCVSVDSGRHFICQCSPGFRGKLCETYINECLSGPCVKGVCIDEEDSYSCICDQGYTGYNCDVTIDNCTPGECGNGTCVDGSHTCICYEGFTGNSTCEEKNECLPDPCEHGGVCIDLIDDFVCNCTGTGYTGKNCSILPQKCYNGSCLNDGVCHPHNLGYSCSCAQGYTGDLCQINIDDCTRHYCKNGAVCVDGINSHSCICQPGYSGSQCDVNTHCNDTPCVNKGSCVTTQTGFVCHCLAGYAGILCEVDIDECEHNKCNADKSTCKDGINGYTCECLPGWTGHTCSEHIGQCITSPCTDGSICTDLEDDQFSCTCMEGYTGHNCSVEINECRSSPCFNDGQCIDQVNGYTCTCKDRFTGTNCQHNIDMCLELPCQHNGTCLNLVDTFTCICEAGWTGQRCDTKVDNCLSLPCYNNATCLNIVNDFRCTCLPGYTGNQCQTDINECVSDPCLHDGQCKNVIGGYFCTCTSGYTGPNCNVINQPCPVCQNEATECHNGQCVCLPGYVGPDCGKERDYWYDLYFTPGGRVETEVTRMKNRNQLSLCLWLKVIDSTSSSPVLTLKAVDSDPKIDQEILKLNTDSLHLYYWGERTINFTILEGSWNHICLTWNSEENGQWFLYINGVVQIEGVGFGSGQELPIRQKIVLGPDTVNNNNKFHGIISQVNMYDSMLNATDIATGSGNCSISMPSGTVFRWQDFSSYVNSGAEVIEPSVCRSGGCPTGYSGQFCNSTKDTEPPTVEYCPAFVQVVTTSRLNIVNWTEPRFSDNVEIINIKQSHRSGQVFAYGEYDVMYIAYDRENNTAVCSFTVYVIPSNCTMPVPSSKVIMTCSNWSDGIYCTIRCKNPVMHKFVEEIPPFYKCGREGFWDPPRGEEFTFPTCAESSQPAGTIQGEMVFLGPLCTTSYREILSQNFVNSMNQWNMEFEMCPGNVCNFSNITVECVTSVRRRRRRSTKGTYLVIFDIPVNGSLVSEGDGGLPLTQLETMVKNEEFNTEDFSCDPASLVVKPYVTCQTGQILVNGLCVNCARGTYMNPSSGSCELCPRGQYTDHEKQVRCQSCDLGYTTEFPGASSSSHCYKSCKTGNYFDKSTLDCRPCEIGYYQDETGKMSCKSCGNGQTTQQTGSTSEVDCLSTCGAGTELSVLGICEPCVLGTYKPNDNQDSCQSCPYGYSTLHVGAISVHQCSVVSCPPDYFHNTAAQKCQVCPPAYHQPITGQNSCIPCNKFDIRPKCLSGEIDECALRQDNCDENADCIDTPKHFDCRCKYGYQGNGTICVYKCIGICNEEETCLIDNSGDPQCLDNSESLPVAALAGGASSLVLVMILIITVIVCKRRKRKKIKERRHNYQTIDRVHRELEVVTYPRRIPVTVAYKTNPAYSDSELSDPTFLGNPSIMWSMYSDPHEDLSKYCETSLRRPLRLRITAAMKNEQHFETISNKSWHDSSPGSSLDEYREDSHHSSPNSSISKYRADSNPKDSSPDSSIGQYKEDSLHKNDSPTSNKSDFSDSYF